MCNRTSKAVSLTRATIDTVSREPLLPATGLDIPAFPDDQTHSLFLIMLGAVESSMLYHRCISSLQSSTSTRRLDLN